MDFEDEAFEGFGFEGLNISGPEDLEGLPDEIREQVESKIYEAFMLKAVTHITYRIDENGEYLGTQMNFREGDDFAERVVNAPESVKEDLLKRCIVYTMEYLADEHLICMQ